MSTRRRGSITTGLLALSLGVVMLSSCSATPSSSADGSATPTQPPPLSVLFVSFDPFIPESDPFLARVKPPFLYNQAWVADPTGQDPLLVAGRQAGIRQMWASADASVIAYVTTRGVIDNDTTEALVISGAGGTSMITMSAYESVAAAVAPDGHAVYVTMGHDVVAYDTATTASRTLCTACVVLSEQSTGLAVSADETRVAVSGAVQPRGFGIPQVSRVDVTDSTTSKRLWQREIKDWITPRAEVFVDDDTLVESLAKIQSGDLPPVNPEFYLVSQLGSGHPVERSTGLIGYGPVTRLDGQWWYARDSWNKVTSLYTNPDLTLAHESKVVDRIDGPHTFGYIPVTSRPVPISPTAATATTTATAVPSTTGASTG
jgi:hypothetical protein